MEARPEDVVAPVEQTMVDAGLYIDGRRIESPTTIAETVAKLRATPGAMAWIGLFRPTEAQLRPVAEEFGLHEVAVEDAIVAHQRPKLERYGETLFVVLLSATYLDLEEEVEFGEIHVFAGPDFVLTVRHSRTPDLAVVRQRMESSTDLLALGPEAVLYAILDSVVDGYAPVVAGLDKDIDEIEAEVFRGDPKVSRRIYELSGEVIEFQRSTRPLHGMLEALVAGFEKYETKAELQRYLRDVADHATTVTERVMGFRQNLSDILTVNATLVNQAQNEEVKRISAWAAIIFAPTLIGTIYGMNFDMPELHWAAGYPFSIALMIIVSVGLWLIFRKRGWL
jgi:magnesium transporter